MSVFALGAAVVEIKAEFSKFRTDLEKARRETKDSADKMGASLRTIGAAAKGIAAVGATAGVAAGGLFLLVQRAANAAEEIADMADKVGVSTERLQELRFAFTQNGSSIADVNMGLSRLNAGLGAFVATGTGPAKEGLAALGITTREAAAQLGRGEQAFDNVVKRLAAIQDPAQRAGAAARIFGEEAGPKLAILIGKGTGEIDALSKKAREMGLVLRDDAVRQAAALSAQLRALGEVISTQMTGALIQLTPQIAAMAEAFANSLPTILRWIEATGRAIGVLDAPLAEQIAERRRQIEELEAAAQGNGATWLNEQRQQRAAALREELAGLEERQRRLNQMVEGVNSPVVVPPLPPGAGGSTRTDPFAEVIGGLRTRDRAALEAQMEAQLEANQNLSAAERTQLMLTLRAVNELREGYRRLAAETGQPVQQVTPEQVAQIEQYAYAVASAEEPTRRLREAQEASKRVLEEQARGLEALEDSLIDAVAQAKTFEDAWKSVARALLTSGLQGLLSGRGAFGGLANDLLGVASGGLGGLARNLFGGFGAGPTLNANGNAFRGGRVIPFARGGVVTGPTLFPMADGATGLMGEAGEEGILPLRRGPNGRLGVEASGGGGVLQIVLGPDLEARWLQRAEGRTVEVVQSSQQGPGFAARVAAANRDAGNARLR